MRSFFSARFFSLSLKWFVFGGILAAVALLCGVPIYVVEVLIRPKKIPRFGDRTYTPFEMELPGEAVRFPSRMGDHHVSGWFIPYPNATTAILVCPGYRTGKEDTLGLCHFLWKAGHTVLVFDYYGHGSETGTPVTLGYREMQDFLGAMDYLKARVPNTPIGVMAYSMGAAIAIMCSKYTPEIEAFVVDSSFATHAGVVDYNVRRALRIPSAPFIWLADRLLSWRAGYRFRQVEPLRDIAHISTRPLLIIHGGRDTIVDPHDAFRLYAAASGPKELWIVPEADHCGAYFADRSLYVRKVVAFFKEHLKQQPLHPHLVEVVSLENREIGGYQTWLAASRYPETPAA